MDRNRLLFNKISRSMAEHDTKYNKYSDLFSTDGGGGDGGGDEIFEPGKIEGVLVYASYLVLRDVGILRRNDPILILQFKQEMNAIKWKYVIKHADIINDESIIAKIDTIAIKNPIQIKIEAPQAPPPLAQAPPGGPAPAAAAAGAQVGPQLPAPPAAAAAAQVPALVGGPSSAAAPAAAAAQAPALVGGPSSAAAPAAAAPAAADGAAADELNEALKVLKVKQIEHQNAQDRLDENMYNMNLKQFLYNLARCNVVSSEEIRQKKRLSELISKLDFTQTNDDIYTILTEYGIKTDKTVKNYKKIIIDIISDMVKEFLKIPDKSLSGTSASVPGFMDQQRIDLINCIDNILEKYDKRQRSQLEAKATTKLRITISRFKNYVIDEKKNIKDIILEFNNKCNIYFNEYNSDNICDALNKYYNENYELLVQSTSS